MPIRQFNNLIPSFGKRVYIDEQASVIGEVIIANDVSVWPGTVIRGDVAPIRIGSGTNIQDGSVLHGTHAGPYSGDGFPLSIGDYVTVGHGAVVHACSVGNHCLIGIGAIVMDGAVIQDNVILGAGGLVAPGKQLESGFLYVGAPARKIRELTKDELEFLDYSAKQYIQLKDSYLKQLDSQI
ncbi:MAG TPA: gamma carbonic anhydrase family protein [Crenotrichaceae bacterium]|nr:gamma carbonic anhydrase family protein [Crenotrichaceae bacterium]